MPRKWSVHDTNLHSFHIPFAYFNISGHLLRTPKEECGRQQSKVKTLLLHRFAFCEFHVTDSQNTRDHITSGRRSKRAWSNCVLCISFIVSGSPEWDKCYIATYVRRMRNKNLAIRIVGSSCRLQEYIQRYNMGFLVVYLLHHHVRLKRPKKSCSIHFSEFSENFCKW